MKTYKGILVGKGSALEAAMEEDAALLKKGMKVPIIGAGKVYKNTSERFEALYGKEDATWFYNKHKEFNDG